MSWARTRAAGRKRSFNPRLLSLLIAGVLASLACSSSKGQPAPIWPDTDATATIAVNPLQQLINEAPFGSTLVVPAGTYEGGIRIEKRLTLIADGEVWIDARCEAKYGIDIEISGVVIKGIGVRNAAQSAVTIGQVSDVSLDALRLADWNCIGADAQSNAGIACWYCSRLTVTNSDLDTFRTFGNGIWVKSTSSTPGLGGHVFSGNRIRGGFDGIGSEAEDDILGGFVRDTLIEGNDISGCRDDGIQVEGANQDIVVRGNVIRGCGIGIALAPNLIGPLLIEGNRIFDLKPGFYDQQACFKVGDGGVGMATLRGNVCISEGEGLKQTNPGVAPLTFIDNCIRVTTYAIYLQEPPPGRFAGNWLEVAEPPLARWGSTVYASVEELGRLAGIEGHAGTDRICALP